MRNLFLAALLLSGPLAATAQRSAAPDYVVTTAGDTLRGHLRRVGSQYQLVRLYRPGQAPADFTPADATSFGSSQGPEKVTRRLTPSAPPRFMTPVVEGPVGLLAGENTRQKPAFFLQLPDSASLVEVPSGNNVLLLARALPGCASIDFGTDEFQRRYPYSRRGLAALVADYNRCRYPERPGRSLTRMRTTQLYFGVKAGVNLLQLELYPEIFPVSTGRQNTGFQGGVMMHMATRTRFSAQAELLYVALRSTYDLVDIDPINPARSTS